MPGRNCLWSQGRQAGPLPDRAAPPPHSQAHRQQRRVMGAAFLLAAVCAAASGTAAGAGDVPGAGTAASGRMPPAGMNGPAGVQARGAQLAAVQRTAKTVQSNPVIIAGFAFNPAQITIQAGQSVTWTNRDAVAHTVTGQKGDWDSGNLATGARYSHLFQQPGIYDYVCAIHPNMTGVVVVR